MTGILEHANLSVSDVHKTAAYLCDLFDWTVRWEGASIHDGYSLHVGGKDSYLALYRCPGEQGENIDTYFTRGGLNHLGVVVADVDAVEKKVVAHGFEPHSHADYEPGRRFYFYDHDGIEIEVVQYD